MSAGALISSEEIETSIPNARAWKVRYASKDVADRATEVTGLVVAPMSAGIDRPIMTWAHGTTGIGDAACPSAQPDPARELVTYFTAQSHADIDFGIPGVTTYIDAGYVVVATDYQGLGTPGVHQYMVSVTNARDAVYIAHAARSMDVGAGTRLLAAGWSQGGGTAAALAELGDEDFGDLQLLGAALLSPGVPTIALEMPTGPSQSLASDTVPPDSHLVMLLMGMSEAFDELELSDALSPLGVELMQTAWNHQPVHHLNDTLARTFHLKGAILHPDRSKLEAWKSAIASASACQRAPRCPLLMCVDSFGNGTVVPVAWQDRYQQDIEKLGATLTRIEYPHDDHFSLPVSSVNDVAAWFATLLR